MTDKQYLKSLGTPTSEDPLRILFSSCLMGTLCGADGSSYGTNPHIRRLADFPNVRVTAFCPEDFSFGTPREIPDIKWGTGADVLDGKARVITETGKGITDGMVTAAKKMLSIAEENNIELAILMDVSAALLERNGFKIISQRDYRSLEMLFSMLDANHLSDPSAKDHDETERYRAYFGG